MPGRDIPVIENLAIAFLSHLVFPVLYMQWAGNPVEPIIHHEFFIEVPPEVRANYLARAILWEPRNISELTAEQVREGESDSLQPGQEVHCTYLHKTPKELGGSSPKFECRGDDGEIYHIKYGIKAHTSVAASRLFWALGFGAAISTPITVVCKGCPPDPWKMPEEFAEETTFTEAAVVKPKPGKEITILGKEEVGWSWKKDLPLVSREAGGATLAQIDALKLLTVLIQHGDSKAAQQKLICRQEFYDAKQNECRRPYMYIYDLGYTFGSDGLRVHPLDFVKWRHKSVFRSEADCIGNLRQNAGNGRDGLMFPQISDEGRLFLADLLSRFITDRSRVVAMFEVAHMEKADPGHTAQDWAEVFISKTHEIMEHPPCP